MSSLDSLTSTSAFDNEVSEVEETYKSVSRLAVFALILGVFGLLSFLIAPILVLSVIGLVCGVMALRTITNYPDEFTGRGISRAGTALCALTVVIAPIYHTYIYYTEVPEGYQRVEFTSLKSGYGMPDVPTDAARSLNGQKVFVKGYIYPNSVSSKTFNTFVLVPDLATCCFGSQPPMTHMIQVNLSGDQLARYAFRKFKLAGTLHVDDTVVPTDGASGVYYTLNADIIK